MSAQSEELFRKVGRAAVTEYRSADGWAMTDAEAEACGRAALRVLMVGSCVGDCGWCTFCCRHDGHCAMGLQADGRAMIGEEKPGPDCPASEVGRAEATDTGYSERGEAP